MTIHAELIHLQALLTPEDQHCAFTTLAHAQGIYYVAYRQAPSHGIEDTSCIVLMRSTDGLTWSPWTTLQRSWQMMDLRDPRFFRPDPKHGDVGLLIGAYTPLRYPCLDDAPAGNSISTWAATVKQGGVWDWKGLATAQQHWLWSTAGKDAEVGASYCPGGLHDDATIWIHTRFLGRPAWSPKACVRQGPGYSEPLVFELRDRERPYGCFVRTHSTTELLTFSRPTGGQYRLQATTWVAHFSAIIPYPNAGQEPSVWIVAGRQVGTVPWVNDTVQLWTCRWNKHGQHMEIEPLLVLPSKADCGYTGLCWHHSTPETLLVSYYSQHESERPAAKVYIAHVQITGKA